MRLTPHDWARSTAARTDDEHRKRVRRCTDVDRLRAAVAYEATRTLGARPDRVARLNQRIAEVTE
jgi:hypothetical protein